MKVEPDPHDRTCAGCGMLHTPYSMAVDRNIVFDSGVDDEGNVVRAIEPEDMIVPPRYYECLSCRSLAKT